MSIQFACPGCSQPVEVDSEHAGGVATCPYCRNVVNVPQESTYRAEAAPPARPAGGEAYPPAHTIPSPADELHPQSPPPRLHRARKYGFCALACFGIVVVLFVTMMAPIVGAFLERAGISTETQPAELTPEDMSRIQGEIMQEMQSESWFLGVSCASNVFAIVGLALSVASVAHCRKGNWPGILALILCGLCALCFCGGALLQFAGPGAG